MKFSHQGLALLVTLIWGTNFVFIRYGLDELPAFTFAVLRFTFVAFPLIFFLPKPQVPWSYLAAYGLLIGVGQFGLLFWAMQDNISPGLASLVIQMQVFFTVLLASLIFQERLPLMQWLSLGICLLGLTCIIGFSDEHTTPLGLTLVLIGALSWALANTVTKKAGQVNFLAFVAWSSVFSIPPLISLAWYFEGLEAMQFSILHASWRGWAVIFWQSIGNTLIGFGLWNFLLNRYPAGSVAPWALMVPVFGMASAALLLAEAMPWWKLLAAALILSGLVLNVFSARSKKASAPG